MSTSAGPSKKRKEEEPGSSSDVDMAADDFAVDVNEEQEEEEGEEVDLEEKAMKLWQTVKEAEKDGRPLSVQFLKLPSPKLWPDYYTLIPNRVALEDIKKKIKSGKYLDLEAVRQDFELCFTNAKTYNASESTIYSDAKDLLKLANKTYRKLMRSEGKPPSMKRLLNSRIQKLIKKTDDNGRVLSTMFWELPDKNAWPIYYKQIQQPRCLEAIQKRLKRKEYSTSAEFAADVELVFSNAMDFNMEHTQIWEDALTLRDYFRQLMGDLPPPYALAQYTHPPSHKIKIKMPGTAPKVEEPAPKLPTLSLRVPAPPKPAAAVAKPRAPSPQLPVAPVTAPRRPAVSTPASVPVVAPTPAPPPVQASLPVAAANLMKPTVPKPVVPASAALAQVPKPAPSQAVQPAPVAQPTSKPPVAHPPPRQQPPRQATSRTPQPHTAQPILQLHPTTAPSYSNVSFAKTTQPAYMRPTPPPIQQPAPYIPPPRPAPTPTPAVAVSAPPPPAPVIPASHQLRYVALRTEPCGRPLNLDHRDSVTTWAMRLEQDEKSLSVREITFMAEPGDSSDEDEDEDEEEIDVDVETEQPVKKRRGRPPKVVKVAPAAKPKTLNSPKKKKVKKRGDLQVKVNGTLLNEDEERAGNWTVALVVGSNILEVGEKGGLTWKVYAERVA
ncbi:Bromodomain-containing protein [Rhodocollybia butyracea]|uniref:Bromodomain-containing protein n=1 Tax=Rhodocollybia butyracea TaxID=206335 RepID=A0A9P5Q749_9AGAR|nr:Bromodomain-containing protein [Rhodocollybia butyracea]